MPDLYALPCHPNDWADALASWRSAKWTCAIDAAAAGVSSNTANSASTVVSSSRSSVAFASLVGNGGSASCNADKSSATSSPIKSPRTARDCPSFTNVGPSVCNAVARRSPGRSVSRRRSTSPKVRTSHAGAPKLCSGNSATSPASC